MSEPDVCTVCGQRLHRVQHAAAHGGRFTWNAEVRTCPHNLYSADHFDAPRHDEWHRTDDRWVRRET